MLNVCPERGHELTFRAPKTDTPSIIQGDILTFNHIILFTPDTKCEVFPVSLLLYLTLGNLSQDITLQSLVAALNPGTSITVALSYTQSPIFALTSAFSLILLPPGTPLISHFPVRDTPPSVIPVSAPSEHPFLTPNTPPVWFSGIPFAQGNNPLLVPILRAPAESFASDTDSDSGAEVLFDTAERDGEGFWAGSSLGVVTGFQTRDNSARVTWVGGIELFSDAYVNKNFLRASSLPVFLAPSL